MPARSQEESQNSDSTVQIVRELAAAMDNQQQQKPQVPQPLPLQQQRQTQNTTRYSSIAPRPPATTSTQQQHQQQQSYTIQSAAASGPTPSASDRRKSKSHQAAATAATALENDTIPGHAPAKAKKGKAKAAGRKPSTKSASAASENAKENQGAPTDNPFMLDDGDALIQELLAGIPSTAWLPTDPLTSEDWFPDPSSSVITQENIFQYLGGSKQSNSEAAEASDTPKAHAGSISGAGSSALTAALQPSDFSVSGPPAERAATMAAASAILRNTAAQAQRLDTTSSVHTQPTPEARFLANVRLNRNTSRAANAKLISPRKTKRGDPLRGFAKKHGIGYPVGNQMAILSPALLSSSPPKAKQLRQHPYKYYSPPKPSQRLSPGLTKGRNLMFQGTPAFARNILSAQSSTREPSAAPSPSLSTSKRQTGSEATSARTPSAAKSRSRSNKWEISQDKLLLKGVRQQRWKNSPAVRDPNCFSEGDWEIIAQNVSGGEVPRTAKQCRRRWAVMHAHLGSEIMNFVDCVPSPQSSAQETPRSRLPSSLAQTPLHQLQVEPAQLQARRPDSSLPENAHSQHIADLPLSSPPFMPMLTKPRIAANPSFGACRDENSQQADRIRSSPPLLSPESAQISTADGFQPQQGVSSLESHNGLGSMDLEKRWSSPFYCQLLADVVQALSDPGSQAAGIARKHAPRTSASAGQGDSNVSHKNKCDNRRALPVASSPTATIAAAAAATKTPAATRSSSSADILGVISSLSAVPTSSDGTNDQSRLLSQKQQQQQLLLKGIQAQGLTSTPKHSALLCATDSALASMSSASPGMPLVVSNAMSSEVPVNTVQPAPASPPTSTSMKTTAAALDTMDLTTAGIPTASSSSGNTSSANLLTMPASGELDVGMVDQDLSMYLQFLQSLTSDQIDLCLDGSTNAGLHSAGNGQDPNAWSSILSDIGSNGMAATSSPAATVPAAGVPSSLLAIPSSQATGLAGAMAKAQQNMDVDEDDAADGDFVLEEEDMDDDYDDDEADDDDDDEEEGDAEAYGRCVNGEAGESKPSTHHSSSGTALSTLHAGGYPAQQGSSQSVQPLAWDYALNQLGFSSDASIAIGTTEHGSPNAGAMSAISVSGNTGSTSLLAPDPLIQQLMQGVADMSKHGEGGSADTEHSIWKPNAANTAMLPEWNSGATSGIGSSIDRVKSNQKGTTRSLGKQAGKKAAQLHPSGPGPGPASARTPKKLSKSSSAIESPSSKAAAKQQQSMQQRASGDGGTPLKRGMLKTPRKRKKVTSESIAQVLSAAVKGDTDSLLIGEQNGIDFEMSGLYQDALQEGEEIDVQEESLVADNSDFLFTSEQMSQLREQQVQNFQFVTQAFLISCAESGPHGQRARHWKKQLDQLALWHSLGTRESPSDLMSKDGLKQFGTLIESAERMRARTGTVGVTEYGRFVPNPASFFAIPGITAVIPDIYEAVDEIHRVTQLPAEHDGKGSEGSTSSSDSKAEYFIGMLGNTSMIHGSSNAGAETRSFDGSMDFTPKCCCTPTRGFKSALMIECVFPRLYLEMRNVKRKASDAIVEGEVKAADAGSRHQAILPASSRNEGGGSKQARHTNSKPAAPQARPISRQLSAPAGKGRGDGTAGSGLPAIMPSLVCESPPTYKQSDIRILVDEMRSQMRSFKRDIHRVPRNRRRIFVQGEDGVPRLEWMKVKIEPLPLPLAMQCLLAPMVSYCGFRESMLPNIVAVRKPKNRIHFLESEDTLLLHGLKLFGIEDVASMRVHLMPCKTASQLRNRMNNLRARRAPPNPVKDFCLRRIAPFTLEEEEILRVGVVAYGDEFKQVNQNFLVNRPIIALTRVWNHLRNPDKAA